MENMLTAAEVAANLQVSYDTALDFIKYSGIDYVKIGRQYRVSEKKMQAFLSRKGKVEIDIAEKIS